MGIQKNITIVAFGDSITLASRQPDEGRWPELLKQSLGTQFPGCAINVINAGVGGNSSREGLARIEEDVLKHRPDFVTIEFGNDATPDVARHVEYDEFVANIQQMVNMIANTSGGKTTLLTFPPVIDDWHANGHDPSYKEIGGADACQEGYRKLTRQFARDHDLPLVDVDKALRQQIAAADTADYILPDGVHLTAGGNQVVAQVTHEALAPQIAQWLSA